MWPEKQRSDGWEGAVREGVWAAYEAGKSKKKKKESIIEGLPYGRYSVWQKDMSNMRQELLHGTVSV